MAGHVKKHKRHEIERRGEKQPIMQKALRERGGVRKLSPTTQTIGKKRQKQGADMTRLMYQQSLAKTSTKLSPTVIVLGNLLPHSQHVNIKIILMTKDLCQTNVANGSGRLASVGNYHFLLCTEQHPALYGHACEEVRMLALWRHLLVSTVH